MDKFQQRRTINVPSPDEILEECAILIKILKNVFHFQRRLPPKAKGLRFPFLFRN